MIFRGEASGEEKRCLRFLESPPESATRKEKSRSAEKTLNINPDLQLTHSSFDNLDPKGRPVRRLLSGLRRIERLMNALKHGRGFADLPTAVRSLGWIEDGYEHKRLADHLMPRAAHRCSFWGKKTYERSRLRTLGHAAWGTGLERATPHVCAGSAILQQKVKTRLLRRMLVVSFLPSLFDSPESYDSDCNVLKNRLTNRGSRHGRTMPEFNTEH